VSCKTFLEVTIPTALSTFAAWDATTNKITYTKVEQTSAATVFGKHNINFKWTTALGVEISFKNKAYVMNKAACVSATFTLKATQTLTYRDDAANTAYTLPEIVTNPADCRTIMEY
jgi:hypothetical protein